MNTNLKRKCLAVCLLILCSGCIAQNRITQFSDNDCNRIHEGKIDYKQISNNEAQTNSAYINCAISVNISEPEGPDENSGNSQPFDTTKVADHFLKEIDPSFKDQYGNSLLSIVVISFSPTDWKLKTIRKLIAAGVDINSKNIFEKTALDLARTGGEPELTQLLETLADSAKNKPSPLNQSLHGSAPTGPP